MILTLRTDSPVAEVGLYDQQGAKLSYYTWPAHRQLAKELLGVMYAELKKQNASWSDLTGVVVYQGPGSFTGLRIGITVANTLAYSLTIPVVGSMDDVWLGEGIGRIVKNDGNDTIVLPHYGAEAHITTPRK